MVGLTEEYKNLKNKYVENIQEMWNMFGGVATQISIIGTNINYIEGSDDTNKNVIIHIPLINGIMDTTESKLQFVNEILPKLSVELKNRCTIDYVIFATEAWLRQADPEIDDLENWKNIPITKDAFVIIIEGPNNFKEQSIYDIERLGKQINKNGELVDNIKLTLDVESTNLASVISGKKSVETQGIFNDLYKKITNGGIS
jgi:uncharacterized protein (DUF1330 family)